jgi:hypothetical protein
LAHGIPARLTAREGRSFALTVGIAFLALAALLLWRGRERTAAVLAAIGGALLLAGMLAPARLGPVYRAWMGLALLLSKITTPIFMGVVYFVVLTPTALLRRAIGGNPMAARPVEGGGVWAPRIAGQSRDMTHQF